MSAFKPSLLVLLACLLLAGSICGLRHPWNLRSYCRCPCGRAKRTGLSCSQIGLGDAWPCCDAFVCLSVLFWCKQSMCSMVLVIFGNTTIYRVCSGKCGCYRKYRIRTCRPSVLPWDVCYWRPAQCRRMKCHSQQGVPGALRIWARGLSIRFLGFW